MDGEACTPQRDGGDDPDLQAQVDELEAFTYRVSHDLRTHLRAITALSEWLIQDHARQLDDEGRDYLQRLHREARHLNGLVTDLLQLSRARGADIRREPVSLTAIAYDVAAELRRRDPERDAAIQIQENLSAEATPRLARALLENLLENAWKYTGKEPEARIEVGAEARDGATAYYVRDNGAGFPPERAHELFEPFTRLHDEREFRGTGVGLTTVRRIAERHGGRAWAESEGPGKGATFWFTLDE